MAVVKKVKEGWDGAEKGAHLDAHMMLSHGFFFSSFPSSHSCRLNKQRGGKVKGPLVHKHTCVPEMLPMLVLGSCTHVCTHYLFQTYTFKHMGPQINTHALSHTHTHSVPLLRYRPQAHSSRTSVAVPWELARQYASTCVYGKYEAPV